MLIVPRTPQIIAPVPLHEWRQPSARRTLSGIENRTWFAVNARTSDGVLWWRGWFEDRFEADAFLLALVRHLECGDPFPVEMRRAPLKASGPHTPVIQSWFRPRHDGEWRLEWANLPLLYEFRTYDFLTSPTGSNEIWNRPGNFTDADNIIHTLGSGASGGKISGSDDQKGTGGGGAAYNFINNFAPAATETYQIAAEIAASGPSSTTVAGVDGNPSWFGGTTLGGADVGSVGGTGGVTGIDAQNGGAGGLSASGVGSGNNGGNGGNISSLTFSGASGGGGAGGPNAAGSNAANITSGSGAGGAGDGGSGGAGGAAGQNNGGAGINIGGSGPGGGGGGNSGNGARISGGGGNYGGAGGGARASGTNNTTASASGQGIVIVEWEGGLSFPFKKAFFRHMIVR